MNKGEMLKNSVLQLAISGKLVPQNENKNSSDLVKSIFSKKMEMIKNKKVQDKTKPSIIYKNNDNEYFEKIGRKSSDITNEIPFEIPENWSWVRLFSACDIYNGNSINKTEKETKYLDIKKGYNYIATKDVGFDNAIDYENGVKIPFGMDKFRIASPGSILLCIEGGSAGRKIAFNEEKICFGNKLANFQSFEVNNRFLFYYLQSPLFKDVFKSEISGIIGGVGISKIRKMFLPVPPLEEQKRIVEKIEEVLPLIEKYGKLVDELEHIYINEFPDKIRKSILQVAIQGKLTEQDQNDEPASILLEKIRKEKEKLIREKKIKRNKNEFTIYKEKGHYYEKIGREIKCIDDEIPFKIPENWVWCNLRFVCTKLTDGSHNPPPKKEKGFPVLSVKNIKNEEISFENLNRFTDEEGFEKENKRTNITKGDIILGIVGSIGASAIYTHDKKVIAQRSVAIIHTLVYNPYVRLIFGSPYFQDILFKKSTGTAQKGIYLGQISKLIIPVPPLNEQKRIVEKIEEVFLNNREFL